MALRMLLAVLALVCAAHAWGPIGHEVVATIASNLLSQSQVENVLSIVGADSLASVANWADQVRSEPSFKWSAPLHYINTPDNQCSYDYSRDCVDEQTGQQGFCVAGAIYNFTQQLQSISVAQWVKYAARLNISLANTKQAEALKFIIHFVGDIHQPLHVGFTGDRGGNSIKVTYYGQPTNLHATWDDGIIGTLLQNNYSGSQDNWASDLTARVQSGGMWSQFVPNWASCNSGAISCTTIMATESVKYACSNAYECQPQGGEPCPSESVSDGDDLATPYYDQAAPVVSLRIAQAGVRLAALLSYLFPTQK